MKHLQTKESLHNIEANNLYNHIINTEKHTIKLNYGGYDSNDQAYDFSLICPNGLYRGNYEDSSTTAKFIIKIV